MLKRFLKNSFYFPECLHFYFLHTCFFIGCYLQSHSSDSFPQVLQVLSYQLIVNNLEGDENCKKSVFILLTLLVLDTEYFPCLSAVHACLEQITRSQNSPWVGNKVVLFFSLTLKP